MNDELENTEIQIPEGFKVAKKTVDNSLHINIISQGPSRSRREALTYVRSAQGGGAKSNSGFVEAEYDFIEIGKAEDTDSFVYQSIFKRLSLAMAQGFSFVSRNRDALTYIQERIAQLEVVGGQTFWSLVTEALGCLFRYNNCFIVKSRDAKNSGGKTRLMGDSLVEPISELCVVSPETMQIKIGKNNRPIAYKHTMPDGRYKIYLARDVVHIHINKKPHFISAAPSWQPVLADVAALRRIEENIENLVYQHLYPLYQYKVGTPKAPARRTEDGVSEIDQVRVKLHYMPSDGVVVTPDRHEIKLISDGRVMRAEGYLEHFKNRVIAGAGMSQIDFGDGDTANRGTADVMSKLAVSNVKFYQKVLADEFNFQIIKDLLLESSFGGDVLHADNVVKMQFAEIDLETQIKIQNHYMLLFNGNMITRTHARNMSGWEALSEEEEEDMFLTTVFEGQEETKQEGAMALAKSKQQPSNQHGTNSGPTKRKSSVVRDSRAREIFDSLRGDIKGLAGRPMSLGYLRQIFFSAETQIVELLQSKVRRAVIADIRGIPLSGPILDSLEAVALEMEEDVRDDVSRLLRESLRDVTASFMEGVLRGEVLDSVAYRINFIERTSTHKAAIRGKAVALRLSGTTLVRIKADPEGDDYDTWDGVVIDLSTTPLDRLPPFHPNCSCEIVPL